MNGQKFESVGPGEQKTLFFTKWFGAVKDGEDITIPFHFKPAGQGEPADKCGSRNGKAILSLGAVQCDLCAQAWN